MTRTAKITKLANAIREYRGITQTPHGAEHPIWKRGPKQVKQSDIARWLKRLNLGVAESFKAIDGFKSFDEFRAWLKSIE